MSGTIWFVFLMQQKGLVLLLPRWASVSGLKQESKRIKRIQFQLGSAWFSLVQLGSAWFGEVIFASHCRLLQAWLPSERCGPRSNFWPHSVLCCALFTGKTNFSILLVLLKLCGHLEVPGFVQHTNRGSVPSSDFLSCRGVGQRRLIFLKGRYELRDRLDETWELRNAAKRFALVLVASSRNYEICVTFQANPIISYPFWDASTLFPCRPCLLSFAKVRTELNHRGLRS